ncbi:MAG: response regulator [Spirochaetales bacterium]|jgi:two-component system cell cycle sensor histidine kinase/response regulator CckA|nr:response regulator [Spirochaetales bacterium]
MVKETPNGKSETILLVDDEESILLLGKEILLGPGYTIHIASDAEQAIDIYRQKNDEIDLVVLDLIMPGIGGLDCMKEILKINPQAKIIVVSGYVDSESMSNIVELGAKNFIRKPYRIGELLDVVRKTLDEA